MQLKTGKMSEYDQVQKGSLKLKGVASSGIKKKKKKDKKRDKKLLEQITTGTDSGNEEPRTSYSVDKRTKAEMAFEKVKAKRDEEQILDKASKTHKERILDFNHKLDAMSEHFDIPKVSWTK